MNRSLRNDIASVTAALCAASFGAFLWLFFSYFSSHPKEPRPDLGLTHALNNHGSYVYLSDSESTCLALLKMAFLAGFLLMIVVAPKRVSPMPPATPRWLRYAAFAGDLRRLKLIFLCSLAICLAIIIVAGRWAADFLVSRGLVLQI